MPSLNQTREVYRKFPNFIYLLPLLLYLSFLVFQGPLRYCLWHMGIETLVYIPKGLMIILFWIVILLALARSRISRSFLVLLFLLSIGFFAGLYYTSGFFQAAFGFWVYTPMLYGTIALPSFLRVKKGDIAFVLGLWVATMAGLLLDYLFSLPWAGFNYELGGAVIESSREWETLGIERCAGFARASFSAAYLLLFPAIYLGSTIKSKLLVCIIWLATGLGLLATTHKTAIGIYIGLTLLAPWLLLYSRTVFVRWMCKALPIAVALIGISLPLLSNVVTLSPDSYYGKLSLSSVGMRFADTWPNALALIENDGNLFLGRGLGGIGSPQKYFQPHLPNLADNMYLSLYASLGVGMLVLVAILVWGLARLDLRGGLHNKLFWFFGLAILTQGWTVNAVENPLASIIFGLSLAYVLRRYPDSDFPRRLRTTSGFLGIRYAS